MESFYRLAFFRGSTARLGQLRFVIPLFVCSVAYGLVDTGRVSAVAASALADPLSVFFARSPGARGAGALAQSKPYYAAKSSSRGHGPVVPSERVLANVRTRPPVLPTDDLFAFPVPPALTDAPLALPAEGTLAPSSAFPLISPLPLGGGGATISPLSTPLPDNTGTGGDTTVTPPVVTAPGVPEPATWGMMLIGLFSVGSMIRRATRAATAKIAGPTVAYDLPV